MVFLPGKYLVMNSPSSDVRGFNGRAQVLGQVIEHRIKLLGFEERFSNIIKLQLANVRFGCDPVRSDAEREHPRYAASSLLIVELAAFSSSPKATYCVIVSPVISTAR